MTKHRIADPPGGERRRRPFRAARAAAAAGVVPLAWLSPATAAVVLLLGLLLAAFALLRRHRDPSAELNPHPVIELDARGRIRAINAATRARFPDLVAKGPDHPFLAGLAKAVAALLTNRRNRLTREVAVGDVVYEQRLVRVPGADRVRLYAVDVTERRRAAEARLQSEEKFARVFRSAPMAIGISRLADGRFLDVNDSFVRLLGFENRHQIIGRTGLEVGLWQGANDRARVLAMLSHDDAGVHSLETEVLHQDGSHRDVLLSVELMDFDGQACVLSTLLDMTERKHAEAGIAVLKAFYENTLKELPIEVAVYDAEGRFFYQNPEALRDEDLRLWLVGKTPVDYAEAESLDPAPYARRLAWVREVVHKKEIGQLEETLSAPDGSVRHLLRVATPVLDDDDAVIYVVSYGMDITDRKRFEQKLLEAKNAAEEMARLKSAFVANMSHEIRTPLTAILGFATVLGEELDAQQRELVGIIKQSGERLLETLNSVLDLARLEANAIEVDPQPVNVAEELLAAARLFKPMALRKGLNFRVETPTPEPYAQLDRACLHRVLSNLLSNAIKFTDAGEVHLVLRSLQTEVQIRVADTGIGIAADFLPHIFEQFKQESTGLARTHTGSGLGLSITHHLVERMHGRIEVESVKGAGTAFTVTFPAMPYKPVCVSEPPAEAAGGREADAVPNAGPPPQ
ncbi:MAG: ATP-binding protein [Rhodothermales bacterium]|nr:ATP-binding protein [Rhodothermales bacterium]